MALALASGRAAPRGSHLPGTGRQIAAALRVAAVALFVLVGWYQSANFVDLLMLAAIWSIAAVGLGLLLGMAGQVSLCQASFMLVGAYAYGVLAGEHGVPTLLALVAAGVAGALLAALLSPILRIRGYMLALATMALSLLITRAFGTGSWLPGGNAGLGGIPPLSLGPLTVESETGSLLLCVVVLAVAVVALRRAFGAGPTRRAIQLIHHDEPLLGAFGRDAFALKRSIFWVAAALAGVAGAIYAGAVSFVAPSDFGLADSFALALAVVIGGATRISGAIVGALVYELSFTVLGPDLADYRFVLLGVLVIVVVHFFPEGVLPSRADLGALLPRRLAVARPPVLQRLRRRAPQPLPPEPLAEPTAASPLAVQLEQVGKAYGALRAVDDLTVAVAPGTLVALVGPNGAGKTTLLDLIAGEQPASAGRLRLGDHDVTALAATERARLGVARTYQRIRLVPSLSVRDNVAVGIDKLVREGRLARIGERTCAAHADAALARVGLEGRGGEPIGQLTFGERRLVEIARVLASRPRLVLLDEPASGLSVAEARQFAALVRELHAGGCTVVLVEHDLAFVRAVAEEVVALDRGRLLAHGPTEEVFALAAFQEAYVGVAA